MTFELLYFDGCPSWKQAVQNLRQALTDLELTPMIVMVKIVDDSQAQSRKFTGSPSIFFNGIDLWPVQQDEYHLGCRVYVTPQGMKGYPTVNMIKQRLQDLLNLKQTNA